MICPLLGGKEKGLEISSKMRCEHAGWRNALFTFRFVLLRDPQMLLLLLLLLPVGLLVRVLPVIVLHWYFHILRSEREKLVTFDVTPLVTNSRPPLHARLCSSLLVIYVAKNMGKESPTIRTSEGRNLSWWVRGDKREGRWYRQSALSRGGLSMQPYKKDRLLLSLVGYGIILVSTNSTTFKLYPSSFLLLFFLIFFLFSLLHFLFFFGRIGRSSYAHPPPYRLTPVRRGYHMFRFLPPREMCVAQDDDRFYNILSVLKGRHGAS